MMLLDTEEVVKKVAMGIAGVAIAAGFGLTYYFGQKIYTDLRVSKNETSTLKNETARLNQETDSIKINISSNTKELKNSINTSVEETKKVDVDVRSQSSVIKQLQQDYEKYKSEMRHEFLKLKEVNAALSADLKSKEQSLIDQLKLRDSVIEKHKSETRTEISALQEMLKNKDREISELKFKLEKEIEWRNKNIFVRPY